MQLQKRKYVKQVSRNKEDKIKETDYQGEQMYLEALAQ